MICEAFLEMKQYGQDLKKDIRSSDLILNGKRTAKVQKALQIRGICPTVSCIRFREALRPHLTNFVVFIIDAKIILESFVDLTIDFITTGVSH